MCQALGLQKCKDFALHTLHLVGMTEKAETSTHSEE